MRAGVQPPFILGIKRPLIDREFFVVTLILGQVGLSARVLVVQGRADELRPKGQLMLAMPVERLARLGIENRVANLG